MLNILNKAVREFRLGHHAAGSEALVDLIDQLSLALGKQDIASTPELNNLLQELIPAQARGDYLRAADLLEYELQRHLNPRSTLP